MGRFYVEVSDSALDAIRELAARERRDIRDQAAILIEEALGERLVAPIRGRAAIGMARLPVGAGSE